MSKRNPNSQTEPPSDLYSVFVLHSLIYALCCQEYLVLDFEKNSQFFPPLFATPSQID